MKPENFRANNQRPFTHKEYLDSLQDGREIYIYGERVKNVTTHPAFRNAAASIGQLYDALHDPQSHEQLCWNTDTGNGGYTHKFFRYATSPAELRQQRDAIAHWSRQNYGWMGRSPDYKAAYWAHFPSFMVNLRIMPAIGISVSRNPASILIMPSSTRPLIAISPQMK